MSLKPKKNTILRVLLMGLIFAFVVGVFIYLGGGIAAITDFSHAPTSIVILALALIGMIAGSILALIQLSRED